MCERLTKDLIYILPINSRDEEALKRLFFVYLTLKYSVSIQRILFNVIWHSNNHIYEKTYWLSYTLDDIRKEIFHELDDRYVNSNLTVDIDMNIKNWRQEGPLKILGGTSKIIVEYTLLNFNFVVPEYSKDDFIKLQYFDTFNERKNAEDLVAKYLSKNTIENYKKTKEKIYTLMKNLSPLDNSSHYVDAFMNLQNNLEINTQNKPKRGRRK